METSWFDFVRCEVAYSLVSSRENTKHTPKAPSSLFFLYLCGILIEVWAIVYLQPSMHVSFGLLQKLSPKTNLPLVCRTCTRLSLGLQLARLDPTRVSFSTFAASLLRSEYVRPVQSCISVNFHMHASVVVIHVRIASSSNQSDREVDVITGRGIVVACLKRWCPSPGHITFPTWTHVYLQAKSGFK